ncbi:hypothetical protein EVAR_64639_1 [Eumeta japonica]|uniref:Uncharacterized protein n=1 Tax=Eumeta variegata TaxID=151549 RepID=A0A4C1ZCD3_EUMVA|nr:hypothetical protein EVAR_64639_1 [Eumeta japonica]
MCIDTSKYRCGTPAARVRRRRRPSAVAADAVNYQISRPGPIPSPKGCVCCHVLPINPLLSHTLPQPFPFGLKDLDLRPFSLLRRDTQGLLTTVSDAIPVDCINSKRSDSHRYDVKITSE